MKKSTPLIALLQLLVLLLVTTLPVAAVIQSINYPANNEIISETSRIKLNVTSNETNRACTFNYNYVRNQTVACNGISLVTLPNADGAYNITVTDNVSSSLTQIVYVIKPYGSLVTFTYALSIIFIVLCAFMIFYLVAKLAAVEVSLYDVGLSMVVLFGFIISYQLAIEYVNVPFLLDWMNIILVTAVWVISVLSLLSYTICLMLRYFTAKKAKRNNKRSE